MQGSSSNVLSQAEKSGQEWGIAFKDMFPGANPTPSNCFTFGKLLGQLVYGKDISMDIGFAFIHGFSAAFDGMNIQTLEERIKRE